MQFVGYLKLKCLFITLCVAQSKIIREYIGYSRVMAFNKVHQLMKIHILPLLRVNDYYIYV